MLKIKKNCIFYLPVSLESVKEVFYLLSLWKNESYLNLLFVKPPSSAALMWIQISIGRPPGTGSALRKIAGS